MWTAIVYDLDGTLIDSAGVVTFLLNGLREERGLPPTTREVFKPWLSTGGIPMIMAALEVEASEAEMVLSEFRMRYQATPTDPSSLYPGVVTTLKTLHQRGIALGICTNKPRKLAEKVLIEAGLMPYFDAISAGGDLPTSKPHPDNLQVCLDQLGSPANQSLMVGDSTIDQRLAQVCGASFAFFSRGYDDGVQITSDTLVIDHHPDLLASCKRP